MPHLLEVAFGVKNQAEEKKRTQCELRQSRAKAQLITVAVGHALQLQGHWEGTAGVNHQSRG